MVYVQEFACEGARSWVEAEHCWSTGSPNERVLAGRYRDTSPSWPHCRCHWRSQCYKHQAGQGHYYWYVAILSLQLGSWMFQGGSSLRWTPRGISSVLFWLKFSKSAELNQNAIKFLTSEHLITLQVAKKRERPPPLSQHPIQTNAKITHQYSQSSPKHPPSPSSLPPEYPP